MNNHDEIDYHYLHIKKDIYGYKILIKALKHAGYTNDGSADNVIRAAYEEIHVLKLELCELEKVKCSALQVIDFLS